MMGREVSGTIPRLRETDMAGVLKAIRAWRADEISEQFFVDPAGPALCRGFSDNPRSGPANLRVAVVAPVDEFFASILSERGRLFAATLAFVAAMVPIVFFIGSMLSRSLRALADGNRSDPEVRAGHRTAGAFDDPRDRRSRPFRLHDAYDDTDVFALRAAAAGGAADRNRDADATRRHAKGSHAAVLRRREFYRDHREG